VWNFIKNNWDTLQKMYSGGFLASRLLNCIGYAASDTRAKEVEEFFAVNGNKGSERTVKQVVELIRANSRVAQQSDKIKEWLQSKKF